MKKKKESITGHAGIYRILLWDEARRQWREPKKSKFEAFRNVDGRRVYRQFYSFKEAKEFRHAPTDDIRISASMTVAEVIHLWQTGHLPHVELPTKLKYEKHLPSFTSLLKYGVEELKPIHIDQLLAKLKAEPLRSTRTSFREELRTLRGIFEYYRTRVNVRFQSPILREHMKLATVRETTPRDRNLRIRDFARFLGPLKEDSEKRPEWNFLPYLAGIQYGTLTRIEEAAALHAEDIDFQEGRVTVCRRVIWLRSKAARLAGHVDRIVVGLKTKPKVIPLTTLTETAAREWMLRTGILTGPLFSHEGGVVSYRVIQRRYDAAFKKAGLPFRGTHIIRHASTTHAWRESGDIHLAQKMAGHADVSTTLGYVHADIEDARMKLKGFDKSLTEISGQNPNVGTSGN